VRLTTSAAHAAGGNGTIGDFRRDVFAFAVKNFLRCCAS
jgi:hypothetical protein